MGLCCSIEEKSEIQSESDKSNKSNKSNKYNKSNKPNKPKKPNKSEDVIKSRDSFLDKRMPRKNEVVVNQPAQASSLLPTSEDSMTPIEPPSTMRPNTSLSISKFNTSPTSPSSQPKHNGDLGFTQGNRSSDERNQLARDNDFLQELNDRESLFVPTSAIGPNSSLPLLNFWSTSPTPLQTSNNCDFVIKQTNCSSDDSNLLTTRTNYLNIAGNDDDSERLPQQSKVEELAFVPEVNNENTSKLQGCETQVIYKETLPIRYYTMASTWCMKKMRSLSDDGESVESIDSTENNADFFHKPTSVPENLNL